MSVDITGTDLVLSGLRPTGPRFHIGNYLGAVRQFPLLQEAFPNRSYFFVADLHTIGDVTDPKEMRANCLSMATELLAAGVDPEKSTLYLQSAVPQLAYFAWLLTAATLDTELLNLPHYREKRDKFAGKEQGEGNEVKGGPATFLMYPILQAADILYSADAGQRIIVPVGSDQRPHIEFTRDLAKRFNSRYGKLFGNPVMPEDINYFTDPEGRGDVRIKGLDGSGKMGKSEGNCVYMDDSPEEIARLVKRGTTDKNRQKLGDPGKPNDCVGIYPLHEYVTPWDDREETIIPGCTSGSLSCSDCKTILAGNISDLFAEFRERKAKLLKDPDYVHDVLRTGAREVRALVNNKLVAMCNLMGLAPYDPS